MICVGITGTTGAGKTTFLEYLSSIGALVIDCDKVYHDLLAESDRMNAELIRAFHLRGDRIDTKELGAIVFQDPKKLRELNDITTPYVKEKVIEILDGAKRQGIRITAIDAIRLLESGLSMLCDFTIAITAPAEVRVKRIMERDHISREYAEMRVQAQTAENWYLERCDFAIENDLPTKTEFRNKCEVFFDALLEDFSKKTKARKEL